MDNITFNNQQWGLSEVKFEKITYNWTISNFPYLFINSDKYFESPKFSIRFGEEPSWFLQIHKKHNGVYYYDVKLCYDINKSKPITGKVVLSFIRKNGKKYGMCTKQFSTSENDCPVGEIQNDEMFDKDNDLLAFDCLTIRCEIIIYKGCVHTSSEEGKCPERQLEPRPFEKLFLAERLSDVQLVAKCGRSLPAHKSVLVTCSPEFEKTFALEEPGSTKLEITECTYEALEEMLRFIYTGKLENIASTAAELLELADKYQIPDLGGLCEEALERSISTDNVMEVIAVAGRHNNERLKTYAIKFAMAHVGVIFAKDQFKFSTDPDWLKSFVEVLFRMNSSI